jgi:hypothetical protein
MYKLLVSAMLIAALSELGISMKDFEGCHSRQCVKMFQKKAIDVLKIDWRPISVFPEEARGFRDNRSPASNRSKLGLDLKSE